MKEWYRDWQHVDPKLTGDFLGTVILLTLGLYRLYFQISLPFQVHFQNWFHHA